MTHLRKMMLEELERRNYSQSTTQPTSEPSRTLHAISTALRINSARIKSANTRPICSGSENSLPTPLTSDGGAPILLHQDAEADLDHR